MQCGVFLDKNGYQTAVEPYRKEDITLSWKPGEGYTEKKKLWLSDSSVGKEEENYSRKRLSNTVNEHRLSNKSTNVLKSWLPYLPAESFWCIT